MGKISNQNPTYNFIFELTDSNSTSNINLQHSTVSLIITPGGALNMGNGIPKIFGSDTLEVQNGAIITVECNEIIPNLIADNGIINVDNKFQTTEKTDITISNNGVINLIGYNLVNSINILNGGSLNYTTGNGVTYTLQSNQNINISSKDFKNLINVSEFMHNFSDEDFADFSKAGALRTYKKLCENLGSDIVQSFINSREEVVDTSLITDNEDLLNSISEDQNCYSSVVNSMLSRVFLEKDTINFRAIDNFISENYFTLTEIAKDPLIASEGKLSTDIIGEISSFLSIDDVQL